MWEKIIDFMWYHPKIYLYLEPKYRALKKIYKRLRSKN